MATRKATRKTYTVQVELTDQQIRYLRESSIERLFNTVIGVLEDLHADSKHNDGNVVLEDLEDSKQLVDTLWCAVRAATWNERIE